MHRQSTQSVLLSPKYKPYNLKNEMTKTAARLVFANGSLKPGDLSIPTEKQPTSGSSKFLKLFYRHRLVVNVANKQDTMADLS